jgi:hypothetical protein
VAVAVRRARRVHQLESMAAKVGFSLLPVARESNGVYDSHTLAKPLAKWFLR